MCALIGSSSSSSRHEARYSRARGIDRAGCSVPKRLPFTSAMPPSPGTGAKTAIATPRPSENMFRSKLMNTYAAQLHSMLLRMECATHLSCI